MSSDQTILPVLWAFVKRRLLLHLNTLILWLTSVVRWMVSNAVNMILTYSDERQQLDGNGMSNRRNRAKSFQRILSTASSETTLKKTTMKKWLLTFLKDGHPSHGIRIRITRTMEASHDWRVGASQKIHHFFDAGFKWSLRQSMFDEWFAELLKFKEKFGHCNVPQKKPVEYHPLGSWCSRVRSSYNKSQKKSSIKLTEENIQQLEGAGFKWSLSQSTQCKSTKRKTV